jgi:hypothetical protein
MNYNTSADVSGRFEEVTEMQYSSIGQYLQQQQRTAG